MNKIYKLVWSRTKNMYVAVCEFAKSHAKASKSRVISRTVTVGVFLSMLNIGFTGQVHAAFDYQHIADMGGKTEVSGIADSDGFLIIASGEYDDLHVYIDNKEVVFNPSDWANVTLPISKGSTYLIKDTEGVFDHDGGEKTWFVPMPSLSNNGVIVSGNSESVTGGTVYTELRPSDNGNYVIQLELYNFISSFPLFCSFLTIP